MSNELLKEKITSLFKNEFNELEVNELDTETIVMIGRIFTEGRDYTFKKYFNISEFDFFKSAGFLDLVLRDIHTKFKLSKDEYFKRQ